MRALTCYSYGHLVYQPISTDWNTVTGATCNLIIETLQQHCVVCWLLCVSSHCVQWGLSLPTGIVTWCTSPYQLTGTLWQEQHITWSLTLYSSTVWFVDYCVSVAIVCNEGSHLLQLRLPGVPAHVNWLEHCDRSDIFDHWHFTAALCGLLTAVCQ